MPDEMYLTLFEHKDGSAVSVGISIADAMSYTATDFARLYLNTVYATPGFLSKRKHRKAAMAWGEEQVAMRTLLYGEAANAAL